MFETVFIIIVALFALGGIWAWAVTKKAKKEGIETEASVSRIERREWESATSPHSSVTEDIYIMYRNQNGEMVEALLSNPGDHTYKVGDQLRVKYLPDRPEYPVQTEILRKHLADKFTSVRCRLTGICR